jgi:putative transposase
MNRRFQTQRQSHRLKDFDYSSPGAYFVTINAQTRGVNWFGTVTRDGMELNDAGRMVQRELENLTARFSSLELDAHVIMPDHIHTIIVLRENANAESIPSNRRGEPCVRPATQRKPPSPFAANAVGYLRAAPGDDKHRPYENPIGTQPNSVGRMVQAFKSLTMREYMRGVRELNWPPFEKRFWQRDYFERVLRDEIELETRRTYIIENPLRWQLKNPILIEEGQHG